jgi:flagellar basal-body rod protein FlgB
MNLTSVPLLDVLRERMSWLSARQNVLSQNVANADSPGYSAADLKPVDFQKVLEQSTEPAAFQGGLVVTDPHHIATTPSTTSGSGFESTTDGNESVSTEEEMMKVADTQAQYQAATNIYAKAISMMRTAIDKGS